MSSFKRAFSVVKYLIALFIGIFLLFYALRNISFEELMTQIQETDVFWVCFALIASGFSTFLRAIRWKFLIQPLDYKPKTINVFHAVNIGYFANLFVPRIGEIAKCWALKKSDQIPVDKAFGTVVVERVFDLLTTAAIFAGVICFRLDDILKFFSGDIKNTINSGFSWGKIIILASAGVIFLGIIILILKTNISKRVKDFIKNVWEGIRSATKMQHFGIFLFLSVLIFFVYLIQTYFLFLSLPSTENLSILDAMVILVISSIALIIPIQGGIGVYHLMISSALVIYGLNNESGLVFATLSHTSTMILMILLGIISLSWLFLRKTKQKE